MRVVIDHHEPFAFASGGLKVQIEQTLAGLQSLGVEARFFRWWEDKQDAEILHFFGIPHSSYIARAQSLGLKVVITHLLTHTCNRSPGHIAAQATVTQGLLKFPAARPICDRMGWLALRTADAVVAGLKIELAIFAKVWGIPSSRLHVVPLGLSEPYLTKPAASVAANLLPDEPFLINVGTICRRKYTLELARLAEAAEVPIVFVGGGLPEEGRYWKDFQNLRGSKYIWHHDFCDDPAVLASLYAAARGFVHFSDGENWCLAAHEAAACRLPLLLRNQPWSRECFGASATFWNPATFKAETLKQFFSAAKTSCDHPQSTLIPWSAVAGRLRDVYAGILPASSNRRTRLA